MARHVWRCLAGLLLCLGLGACDNGDGRDTIRLGIAAGPVTLDPRFATDAASHRISRLLYRGLVDFDASNRPVPELADWSQSDPRTYRFELHDTRRPFHHGHRLTAADVAATYRSVLDPKTGSPHRGSLTVIESIEVIDSDTLVFHLSKPDPLFPGRLTLGILPAEKIDSGHAFGQRPLGSGPLRLVRWPSEERVVLERRADEQRIEIVTVKDPIVRVLKLMRGEIDLAQGDLPQELLTWMQDREGVEVVTKRGSIFSYLGFNLRDPVVGEPLVREAIAYAIDRDAIIEHVLGGAARPAGGLLPADHWAGHPTLDGYAHDPARARALLEQAGYAAGDGPAIVYKTSNNPARIRLATIIQHQLKEVGFDVEIRSYDWGTFYADIKSGQFQMYSLSWVGLKLPDIYRYVFHSESLPPAGANRGHYDNPIADALIEEAESLDELDDQALVYQALAAHLHATLPYVPLWYEDNLLAKRPGIRDYELPPDGNYDGLITVKREQ
ncbi:peptide/nickel transport system substrate-binding protein [Methylohalomonas lacus]|uniref:Peptide/nickel transport system substrate-binding protein n=1 Tax=Methylohalomonas lacus TaxID=398773 RepID=A0AAE3HNH3_9GAMM|nr:ABC transporter substrate-binding protein [Methylohalomonas lacus]MCS3903917.1 peptide/nickel transport system substrate-binding protein [Methylohalomonas lacus]